MGHSASGSERQDLLDLSRPQMEAYFGALGEKAFRARQIFRWLYKDGQRDFFAMTDLPRALREQLHAQATFGALPLETHQRSKDGTQKLLFRLHDGARIESVLIPEGKRMTLCISSQVGCALGCRFCYTATMGPGRNLSVSEYISQYLGALAILPPETPITNIVFMGMGEPLVNFDNLMATLSILTDDLGPNFAMRRLTVSTAGLCPQILKLAERFPVRLAISLHATTDPLRDRMMPINKRYNLQTLTETLQTYNTLQANKRHPLTLEYLLLRGVNDREEDARRLAQMAHTLKAKVNLIPYNEHPGAPYRRPSEQTIRDFHDTLQHARVRSTRRSTRGDDIFAACGQLALESPPPPSQTE